MKRHIRKIILGLELILLVVAVVSILAVSILPSMQEELLTGERKEQYEDSREFSAEVNASTSEVIWGIAAKDMLEVDGEYDPNVIVDLEECYERNTISGENKCGVAFRLGDLLDYSEEINVEDHQNQQIVVCEKVNGTYQYYYYPEFRKEMLSTGWEITWDSEDKTTIDQNVLEALLDEDFSADVSWIKNDKKGIVYVNCWKYDSTYFPSDIPLDGGKTIVDVLNENKQWNGKLQKIAEMYGIVADKLQSNYEQWQRTETMLREGDSNFYYIFVNKESEKVYSNREVYRRYSMLDSSLEHIKTLGKYLVVEPRLEDFASNIKGVNADEWRRMIHDNIETEDYILAIGVDTNYPIQDIFYQENTEYVTYGISAKLVLAIGVIAALLWILGIVWLTKTESSELNRFDKIKTELAASIVVVLWGIIIAVICSAIVEGFRYNFSYKNIETLLWCAALMALISCASFLWGYLSLVRRIKAKTVWKNSVMFSLYKWTKKIVENWNSIWKTTAVFAGVCILLVACMAGESLLGIIVLGMLIFAYLAYEAIGKTKLRKEIARIAEGEINHKVSMEGLTQDQKQIAEMINHIGTGLEVALEKSMKSERMKTDLITNVSHDIKTPLTSIINYIDLLKKENFTDSKVQHYLEVLDAKAQRLKVLTEDVVEASKISSGNISIEWMNINFVEMLQQVSGEFAEKFKEKKLQEVLVVPKEEVVIRADGRRMYRVLENIYNNVAKYAMEGSRVYAELKKTETGMMFSLKNISQTALNISSDELTERFVRGDASRTNEGSGLGLAIAKSLVEMQGGTFEVCIDGDLFKIVIEF